MAHQIFNLPPQQPLSAAGRVLPGSKLYFYLTTTSTPTPVYTTSALSVAHTQPLVADAGGRFDTVYLDPEITYKATVTDANDVLLYTIDPVNDQLLSQAIVGEALYPRTAAEISAAVTPTNYFYPPLNVLRYGTNTTPGTTNMRAAIQAAVDVADAMGGGDVYLPPGNYLISSAINWAEKVSMYGDGHGSLITANDCNAINLDFYTGFGNVHIRDLAITGINGTTRYAIIAPGTTDDADELYGVTLDNLLITDFRVGVHFRTVRTFAITNCWIQDIHTGIELVGKNLVGRIEDTSIVYAAGNGTSTNNVGIELDLFDYVDGSGNVPPESITIDGSYIFGFDTCILATFCNVLNGTDNDLSGRIYGIDITTIQNGFSWKGGTVEMSGTAAIAGVRLRPLASVINSSMEFIGVSMTGSSLTAGQCSGYLVNATGQNNQGNVNIRGGVILGMTNRDIYWFNPSGTNLIDGVNCVSSATTASITFVEDATSPGGHLTRINGCQCAKQIVVPTTLTLAASGVRITDCRDEADNTLHANAIAWYEERDNTTTPGITLSDGSGAGLSLSAVTAASTKVGREVVVAFQLTYPATADASNTQINGLPYTLPASGEHRRRGGVAYSDEGTLIYVRPALGGTNFVFRNASGALYTNANLSGSTITGEVRYSLW